MTGRKGFVVLGALLLVSVSPVWSTPITFEFSGTVTGIFDPDGFFDPSIHIGTELAGSYTFNSDVVDLNDDPRYGRFLYRQPAPEGMSMEVSAGNMTFNSIGGGGISTDNLPGYDIYNIYTDIDSQDFVIAYMELYLKGGIDMLESDSLPLVPPDLHEATYYHTLSIVHSNVFDESYIYGTISSLTHVPEPMTGILLGIGGMFLCRRRVK